MAKSKFESTEEHFLSGRKFTVAEIRDIQDKETIDSCGLSWHELLQTICEHLGWVTPAGRYKVTSCANALRMMESKGLVKLPPKPAFQGSKQKIVIGEQSNPEPELGGNGAGYAPIEVLPIRAKEEMRLWNEYVERG